VHDNVEPVLIVSRSTPRVRVVAVTVLATIAGVAISHRPLADASLLAFITASMGFILVCLAALGRVWTSVFIAGFKDAMLIQSGPYAACRHPLYGFTLLAMLGLGLATRSITLTAILLGVAVVSHLRALRSEDALLETVHGEAALAYRKRTPALLPRIGLYAVPDSLEVRPRVLWKAFVDAGSLLLAYGLVLAAHSAQVSGVTPTLLRLP
jgi:protein-S-isoprenylcysteine O-methyltransferase Ste14